MHSNKKQLAPDLQIFVTVTKAATEIGITPKAIRRKIEKHVWLEGHEYTRTPDGRIFINLLAVARWQCGIRRFLIYLDTI